MSTDPAAGIAEWEAVLDRFERELAAPAAASADWTAPTTPLPAELADRAAGILARQRDRMAEVRRERDDVRAQLDGLRLTARESAAPAYLDTQG